MIDWTRVNFKISKYFTVHEATYLPKWDVHHLPSDQEKENILKIAQIMDQIRDYLQSPIKVHCWIRPVLNNPDSNYDGRDYNWEIGGAKNSAHKVGLAVDWNPNNLSCENARQKLLSKLEELNIRMEDNGSNSNWIHVDLEKPNPNRFFKP